MIVSRPSLGRASRIHLPPVGPARPFLASAALMVGIACMSVMAPPAAAQFTLPTDFADDLVLGGFNVPVGMTFLPDGRLFVLEQTSANVRLIVNGALAAVDPVITVPNVIMTGGEQGLLGIAADPSWPARPYIYLQYDHTGNVIYISRYTVAGDLAFTGNGSLTIDPATRYDILTDLPDNASNHNGGTLRFGPDGMLYSSLGDDATGCPALDLTVLVGKILRLDVSGLPAGGGGPPAKSAITPSDNPFVANPNANAKLVCYDGLRNPFRFAIDRLSGDVAIADVGESTKEEVDFVTVRGSNFEWPVREGDIPGTSTCGGSVDMTYFTEPVYTYTHAAGHAVIGGPIYHRPPGTGPHFPFEYEGDIFVSDFYATWLRRLKRSGNTWSLVPRPGQATDWGTGPSSISDWAVGTDGALYYCLMFGPGFGPGSIRRIRYTGTSSVPFPTTWSLEFRPPYPIPGNDLVWLDYVLPRPSRIAMRIYDTAGRLIRTLAAGGVQGEGVHQLEWNARDNHGRPVAAGVYLARLIVDDTALEHRIVLAH